MRCGKLYKDRDKGISQISEKSDLLIVVSLKIKLLQRIPCYNLVVSRRDF